ncbi:MAG: PRTRC system protein C [Proteobacteria bacterium]|nr:PRTRC system protein C [Pseudomonadota bacterium]
MALEVNGLPRKFKIRFSYSDKTVIDDPDVSMTPEEVHAHLSTLYPEISASRVAGPELKPDCQMFVIEAKSAGVKG